MDGPRCTASSSAAGARGMVPAWPLRLACAASPAAALPLPRDLPARPAGHGLPASMPPRCGQLPPPAGACGPAATAWPNLPQGLETASLLADVELHLHELKALVAQREPAAHLVAATGEKHLAWLCVAANARRPGLNLLFFGSAVDTVQHLHELSHAAASSPADHWRAVLAFGGHGLALDVLERDGERSVLAIESAGAGPARALLAELDAAGWSQLPGLRLACVVQHQQKARTGCEIFAVANTLAAHRCADAMRALHHQHLDGGLPGAGGAAGGPVFIDDPHAAVLHWSFYKHAQSRGQVQGIVAQPRPGPDLRHHAVNRRGDTLLGRHEGRRVTQEVDVLDAGAPALVGHSRSIDLTRVALYGQLKAYLQASIDAGSAEAAARLRQALARTAPRGDADWPARLPCYGELVPPRAAHQRRLADLLEPLRTMAPPAQARVLAQVAGVAAQTPSRGVQAQALEMLWQAVQVNPHARRLPAFRAAGQVEQPIDILWRHLESLLASGWAQGLHQALQAAPPGPGTRLVQDRLDRLVQRLLDQAGRLLSADRHGGREDLREQLAAWRQRFDGSA
jgi:hypothetical protein